MRKVIKRAVVKNPLIFDAAPVADEVTASLAASRKIAESNPFIAPKRTPMKVTLAPLPTRPASEEDEHVENPKAMNPFVKAGLHLVGGSLGGWLVSYVAANAVTEMLNSPNRPASSATTARLITYGAGAAPALLFSTFMREEAMWKGSLAGAALYPVWADVAGLFSLPVA